MTLGTRLRIFATAGATRSRLSTGLAARIPARGRAVGGVGTHQAASEYAEVMLRPRPFDYFSARSILRAPRAYFVPTIHSNLVCIRSQAMRAFFVAFDGRESFVFWSKRPLGRVVSMAKHSRAEITTTQQLPRRPPCLSRPDFHGVRVAGTVHSRAGTTASCSSGEVVPTMPSAT